MTHPGRLIIISAPSGGGKTTVINRFLETHPNTIHSVSWTTRPIRKGEIDGIDYHFIDEKIFRDGIENNQFAEWAEVHNNFYGTPIEPIDRWLTEGKDVLLDLDVIGGLKLKDLYKKKAIAIFLIPPSTEELKKRLVGRGTDSKEVQELRLKNALEELTYKERYDYRVVNDVLERACLEIEEILKKQCSQEKDTKR